MEEPQCLNPKLENAKQKIRESIGRGILEHLTKRGGQNWPYRTEY